MNKEKKLKLINKFEELSYEFDDVLKLSEEILNFKPFSDAWNIREQIVHFLDVDIANFHRYRWGITSPGTKVLSFSQTWTEKLNYQSSDIKTCIDLIKLIRKFMVSHLRTIVDCNWKNFKYVIDDQHLNLEEALQSYINHVDFHRKLIDRNIEMYGSRG